MIWLKYNYAPPAIAIERNRAIREHRMKMHRPQHVQDTLSLLAPNVQTFNRVTYQPHAIQTFDGLDTKVLLVSVRDRGITGGVVVCESTFDCVLQGPLSHRAIQDNAPFNEQQPSPNQQPAPLKIVDCR